MDVLVDALVAVAVALHLTCLVPLHCCGHCFFVRLRSLLTLSRPFLQFHGSAFACCAVSRLHVLVRKKREGRNQRKKRRKGRKEEKGRKKEEGKKEGRRRRKRRKKRKINRRRKEGSKEGRRRRKEKKKQEGKEKTLLLAKKEKQRPILKITKKIKMKER